MLKLLLNHWQAHREPAPFVLTDDPLYCAHLSTLTSKLPEVYSVNRVNPIFEEDEGEIDEKYNHHNRTLSENETRSSDDTGYTSGHKKQHKSFAAEDAYSFDQTASTDSDEPSKSVTVSADVHRVSYPDDVIVLSAASSCSYCASSLSINSNESSQEPFDSLTESHLTPNSSQSLSLQESMKIGSNKDSQQTQVKTPASDVGMQAREKLEKLLQHGNQSSPSTSSDASKDSERQSEKETDFQKTRQALMKSLTRALNQKVPKTEDSESASNNSATVDSVTRSDSSKKSRSSKTEDNPKKKSRQSQDMPHVPVVHNTSSSSGEVVTRQDESVSSHSSSSSSRKHQNRSHGSRHHNKRHHEDIAKPMTLHQLLPGHWSYDNIYLPQMMPGVCYHCFPHGHPHHDHHHHGGHHYPVVPTADMFYPMLYHHQKSRSRHSWAPDQSRSNTTVSEQHSPPSSSKEGSSSGRRYSPDGSSRETESDGPRKFNGDVHERRSLRVPKKCKCEFCLLSAFDGSDGVPRHFPTLPPPCSCCYYPHRKVKFASDTDLSKNQDDKLTSSSTHREDNGHIKHSSAEKNNGSTFHINLHRLNGHVNEKSIVMNEDGIKTKKNSTVSRGQKEPVKMEDIYRSYPINFKDWEAHYKRTYLHKRRKRALNMIGMAIGIILVVGVAIAVTFIFLRLKRPT